MSKYKSLSVIILIALVPVILNGQAIRWISRYNGPVSSDYNDDEPTAIAVDNQGNVYVTGKSVGRVQYPYYYYDFATIKYFPNGDTAWIRRYNGPANQDDIANAIAVDGSGNVYVTGSSYTSDSTMLDYLTIKYNVNGDTVWTRSYIGTGYNYDEAHAIAIDNLGYIYVTGSYYSESNWTDYLTIKYNSNGDTIWTRRYNGLFNSSDDASAIAIDNQNNVYVTGKSNGPGYWTDYATIKYNSAGTQQWVSRYTYTGNNNDEARAIAVDNNGNVYITGYSEQPNYGPGECATVKYNSLGDTVWVRRYSDTSHVLDEGKDIAVDNSGNVYITGVTFIASNTNYLTIKYSPSGTRQWIQRFNEPDSTYCDNRASAIALDTFGNIYVTGQSVGLIYSTDYATVKYNPSGTQKWVARYDGPVHNTDEARAMTVDLTGNVYVTGYSIGTGGNPDYATIKYYQSGPNDVGVDSITYPSSQHLRLTPMIPCAIVKNYGTSPQTNFSVVCSIIESAGSARYTNTKIVSYLADYDTVRVYFDTWTPTITELCTVKFRTNLIGDENPTNDQKTRTCEIANAVLYLSEGFDNTTFPPAGWQTVVTQGYYDWQRSTSNSNPTCYPYDGPAMASYQSYNAPYGSKARLISPPINFGTQLRSCVLNFAMYHDEGESGAADSVKIEYSIDGINFTPVTSFSRYLDNSDDWYEHSVELGVFSGTVYIGILAFSGYGNNMNIDEVKLYGTLPPFNDVGVDEITSPLAIQRTGIPVIPQCRIKNFGFNSQNNFSVVCSIIGANGILRYTNTQQVSSSIVSGDTLCINFTSWTPTLNEFCTVKIRTLLPNDDNSLNDEKSKTIMTTSEQVFLYADFNEPAFPPAGWQSVIVAGSSNWERKTSNVDPACSPYEGAAMASFPSFSSPDGSMARLISPAINLGSAPIPCTLKFAMYHDPGYSSNPDSVRVEYSTDGVNFNRVTAFRRYQSYERWVDHSVYLGTFSGTIYVGLVAFSDYGDNINIDYIRMAKFEQYPNDIGVDAIIQPSSSHILNTQMTPIARIKNFGTSAQTTIPAVCSIFGTGGILRYTNTQSIISLAAGETTQVNFTPWTPTITEQCTVKIRTNLLTDQNPYNNLKDLLTEVTSNQVILTEGFNDTIFPPAGWQSVIVQGTSNWERKTSNEDPDCLPYEGAAMASYNSYSATYGSTARLISPPIVLGVTPVLCSLKFFMYHDPGFPNDYGPDSVKVEYSTDGTTFNRVTAFRRYQPFEGWTEHSVYLGTFSGNLYVGLLAYSDYGNNMNIDYVHVSKTLPLSNDVGVERIVSPGNMQTGTLITPIALVKNYGVLVQTNFPVVCSILGSSGALIYTATVTVASLASNDTTRVTFTSLAPSDSLITVIMRTNTNDQNPTNDRKVQVTHIGTYFLLLSEGFNNTAFPPSGWQSIIVNGNYNWERKTFNENPTCSPYEGSAMASYPCWDAYEGENARFISPSISFGTIPVVCSLKFYMYHDTGWSDCYDFVRIEYSSDGINFNPVDSFLRYQPGPPAWSEHSIYMGSFTGTVYLGIVGYSDYGNNINIDLVKLSGRLIANDVGLDAIVYPSAQHAINTAMIPIARVKNYGSVTQNNFQVICSIIGTGTEKEILTPQDIGIFTDDNKGNSFSIAKSDNNKNVQNSKFKILNSDVIRYIDTLRITSLAPGETAQVNFRTWTPTVAELCTVKMKTNLVADQNQINDRKTRTTTIMPATTIVSPNGGEAWAGGSNKTIRWHSPQIIARYVLLLSTNSGASYSDTIANNLSPTDSTYNWLVPMLNLRTYRVKLAILDGSGTVLAQDASDADFTIDSQLPSAPTLISPANGLYTRDSLPHFWWHRSTDSESDPKIERLEESKTIKVINANQANYLDKSANLECYRFSIDFASGIANYQLQYAMNSTLTGAVQINVADTNYQVISVLSDTTYYWRVRAVDSAGNQGNWSAVWNFEIDRRTPNAPVLISPINGIWLTNTSIIFNWAQVTFDSKIKEPSNLEFSNLKIDDIFASPVRYILQIDTSRNFLNPIIDTTGLVYDTLILNQARYFWRVRAYDFAGNQGINSAIDSFGVDNTSPSIPNLISPTQNAILTDSFVRFYWNRSSDNVSGVRNYLINIANNSNFTGAFDTTLLDTTILRKLRDTTYFWRVRATDRANNQSSWSTVRNFIVRTTGIEEEKYNNLPYITMLYSPKPNPVTNRITQISFSIAEPNPVSVKIYNTSGNLVKILADEFKRPGVYNISWNCQDEYKRRVAEGIYFYALETPKQKFTKKLILTR